MEPIKIYYTKKFSILFIISITLFLWLGTLSLSPSISELPIMLICATIPCLIFFIAPGIIIKHGKLCLPKLNISFSDIRRIIAYPNKQKITIEYKGCIRNTAKVSLYLFMYRTTFYELLQYFPAEIPVIYEEK